jgi:hypothetical protein
MGISICETGRESMEALLPVFWAFEPMENNNTRGRKIILIR